MGPGTGLRQVAISRYSLGYYPSSLIALLNVIEQLGWASVNCITGGLALNAVSDGHVSVAVGVVIIACVSLLFSFVGLRGVLLYEKYAWMMFFVIFMIIYGEAAHRANLSAPPTVTGMTKSGNALSLIGVIYGSSASWSSIVSDFYVHYPVDTSKVKIFLYTTLGITIPTCIGMLLGACISSALDTNPEWAAAYDIGIGEILKTIIYPTGFAKFLLVLLVLSGSKLLSVISYVPLTLISPLQSASTVLRSTPVHCQLSSLRPHSPRSRACFGRSWSSPVFWLSALPVVITCSTCWRTSSLCSGIGILRSLRSCSLSIITSVKEVWLTMILMRGTPT